MKIENGKYSAGEFHERWNLGEEGFGRKRTFSERISFSQTFENQPKVMIAVSGLDIVDERSTSRKSYDVQAVQITTEGFTVLFNAYGNSRIMGLTIDWLAFG